MTNSETLSVGKLTKTFGLKGHIRAWIDPKIIERWKKVEMLKVIFEKKLYPLLINEYELGEGGHCMFLFDDVSDKTAADKLCGKELFLDEKYLKKPKPYQHLSDFIGFTLHDDKLGELGLLEDIFELPTHELGKFTYKGKEVLFPITEQHITDTDKRKKILYLSLPDGLLEVYM